jgi:hypothetical protein
MASKSLPPDAFLSYARFNDQHDDGYITKLGQHLASTVQAVTGVPFGIFQDVEGIGVGEHWPDKLDEMLNEARFFIPVFTAPKRSTAVADTIEIVRLIWRKPATYSRMIRDFHVLNSGLAKQSGRAEQ